MVAAHALKLELQGVAIFLLWLGIEANYNPELNLLNMNRQAATTCVIIGGALFITAALGWTAAASKNEGLAFGVSFKSRWTG